MLFNDHAIDRSFYGDYGDYFSSNTVCLCHLDYPASNLTDRSSHLRLKDHEGVEYLMLANHMLSTLFPFVTTIAEDFAGFPTLALPTHLGGVGFNYRLGLGNPDFCESPLLLLDFEARLTRAFLWVLSTGFHLLKQGQDDSAWKVTDIVASLGNRRAPLGEKSIAFAESRKSAHRPRLRARR